MQLCVSGMTHAAPNLQDMRKSPGMIIFGDHERKDTFYYLRTVKTLANREDAPVFQYHLNRYLGNRQTGNKDQFWVRGVIKFTTTTDINNGRYHDMREDLSAKVKGNARLLTAPVTTSFNKLVYSTIKDDDSKGFSGELAGGVVTGDSQLNGEVTREDNTGVVYGTLSQRHTIGLTALDAELFWENFHNDNLSLSLAYGWTVKGVILDSNDEWISSEYAVADSLPIEVSPKEYPQLFSRNELWQQLRFTHSNLLVMCYDFINSESTDLYYVMVEIRFPTLRDQLYKEAVKFTAGDEDYERTLKFELANDIKDGYEYRVRRLSINGELTQTDWVASNNAMLDVSASASELAIFNNEEMEDEL